MKKQNEWWNSAGGFFGKLYMLGDDSIEGYIPGERESLEERTTRECEGVINLMHMEKHANILDVPCGYGRHSIYLSKMGYKMTGVDINDEHLEFAKTEAKKKGVSIDFLARDMRDIGCGLYGRFDIALNMFFSFGFFSDEEDNLKAMKQFYNSLRDGGQLLIHTDVSPELILSGDNYKLHEKRNLRNGGSLIIKEKYNRKTGRINGVWSIVDKQGTDCMLSPYTVRIYSAKEYEELLRRCGFIDINIYGSFSGESFNFSSKEMVVIGRK